MADAQQGATLAAASPRPGYTIRRRDRHWQVLDPTGELVCLTVYRRGAEEVVRRLDS